MAFDLGALTAYVNQISMKLVANSILEANAAKYFRVVPNIKSGEAINIMATTATIQDNSNGCNVTNSGTTTLTQRNITLCPLVSNEAMCIDKLKAYWSQVMLTSGSYQESVPFEQIYVDTKVKMLQRENDFILLQGNTSVVSPEPTGWNSNWLRCNGFVVLLDSLTSSTVNGNPTSITTGTGITLANVRGIVDGMVDLMPPNIMMMDDLHIFCSPDVYRLYFHACRIANLFNNAGDNGATFDQYLQGTNVRLTALSGLVGSKRLFAGRASEFVIGTDLLSDVTSFKMFYNPPTDEVWERCKYSLGVQVMFPGNIVDFKLV